MRWILPDKHSKMRSETKLKSHNLRVILRVALLVENYISF